MKRAVKHKRNPRLGETQRVGILRIYDQNALKNIRWAVNRTAGKEFQNGSTFQNYCRPPPADNW